MNKAEISTYSDKIYSFTKSLEAIKKKHLIVSWARLAIFVPTLVSWFYIITINKTLGIALGSVGIVVFAILLKKHINLETKKKYIETILNINNEEKACCEGTFSQFDCGSEFIDHSHPYSFDIDLFGNGSLFQYLNRTVSIKGKQTLKRWLEKTPLSNNEIILNQESITELTPMLEFRQEFQTIGNLFKSDTEEEQIVNNWLKLTDFFKSPTFITMLLWIVPIINFGIIGCVIADILSYQLFILIIFVNLGIVGSRIREFNRYYNIISKSLIVLKKTTQLIALIEKKEFKSKKLNELKQKFKDNNTSASSEINSLTILLGNLDIRNNMLAGTIFNIFLLWDWQFLFRIEKWKKNHKLEFKTWLEAIAEFDAIISLSNLAFNNPDYNYPSLAKADNFIFEAEQIGHPLLSSDVRICNDFDINKTQRYAIVTGANMAGKSTFLRTIASNLVLAGCGAPVCANKLTLSPLPLHSSMRAEDSLLNNESYFYAELKRLQKITQELDKGEKLFIILDEILRGTNSEDKRKGSIGFVKKITEKLAHGLVATHDLELARLAEQKPDTFKACCFEVEFKDDELIFDYTLRSGVTQNMNASYLMEKMGIIDKQ